MEHAALKLFEMAAVEDCMLLDRFLPILDTPVLLDPSDCCQTMISNTFVVSCMNGRITGLHLHNLNCTGSIPPLIGLLSGLKVLRLDGNQLSGPIPLSLSMATSLQALFLSRNQLAGELPPELGALVSIQYLHLDNNHFSGSIPTTWSNMSQIQALSLQESGITGPIPSSWSNLKISQTCNVSADDPFGQEETRCCLLGSTCVSQGSTAPENCPMTTMCPNNTIVTPGASKSTMDDGSVSMVMIAGIAVGILVLLCLIWTFFNRLTKQKSLPKDLPSTAPHSASRQQSRQLDPYLHGTVMDSRSITTTITLSMPQCMIRMTCKFTKVFQTIRCTSNLTVNRRTRCTSIRTINPFISLPCFRGEHHPDLLSIFKAR
ncbi:hypothetical protein EDD86DRAFT_211490 [Gorgonomyces haynaldii]|nr:hypothetical protein EDD86DRAFT_211490 [Gorgonomyces haynaldii]